MHDLDGAASCFMLLSILFNNMSGLIRYAAVLLSFFVASRNMLVELYVRGGGHSSGNKGFADQSLKHLQESSWTMGKRLITFSYS